MKLLIYCGGCPSHSEFKPNRKISLSLYLGKQMGERK